MSNETKRDVFEGLLESYMYSADMVIDEITTDGVAGSPAPFPSAIIVYNGGEE